MDMKQVQPTVRNAGDVLVGVAQIRVGLPSLRDAGTAVTGVMQLVTKSTVFTDETDGVTEIVRPTNTISAGVIASSSNTGSYTGEQDGAFILRFTDATTCDIYGPDGYKDAAVTATELGTGYELKLEGAVASGVTLTCVVTTPVEGDTYIVPIWSGLAQAKSQTGIVTPYPPFKGSGNSVGAVKSASFSPKIDSTATLEAGFPAETYDRIVTKVSVGLKFEAQEFKNANLSSLQDMVSKIINEAKVGAVPVEIVMRTRSNNLVTFFVPNANAENLPEIAPTNDFSSFNWELSGSRMSEVNGASNTLNAWLRNAYIYRQTEYMH